VDVGAFFDHVYEHGEGEDATGAEIGDGVGLLEAEAVYPVGVGYGGEAVGEDECVHVAFVWVVCCCGSVIGSGGRLLFIVFEAVFGCDAFGMLLGVSAVYVGHYTAIEPQPHY